MKVATSPRQCRELVAMGRLGLLVAPGATLQTSLDPGVCHLAEGFANALAEQEHPQEWSEHHDNPTDGQVANGDSCVLDGIERVEAGLHRDLFCLLARHVNHPLR